MSSTAPECTHSTVRIFPNNVLPCPVVHQQNSRTAHGMNQPPLPTAHSLFDTNENPLNFLTPSKQRLIAIAIRCKFLTPSKQRPIGISIRYKFRLFSRAAFRNSFACRAASTRSPLVTHRPPLVTQTSSYAAHHRPTQSLAKYSRKPTQLTENKQQRPKSIASFCRFFDLQLSLPRRVSPIMKHHSRA